MDDLDCDLPNSRLLNQKELQDLYTGSNFNVEVVYSRMMSTLFVIIMYSSGMPILYAIGFFFFIITYFVNKLLLLKYYKKSSSSTRAVPLHSLKYFKLG